MGVLSLINLSACAESQIHRVPSQNHTQVSEVETQYDKSMRYMQQGLFQEALDAFSALKNRFPYSRFAALSELRMGDTYLKQERYFEAIDAYRGFLKFHPTHQDAAYALDRIGEAYYAQIPQDWWFLPPSAEKEQDSIRQAIAAFEDLLARYDAEAYAEKARKHLDECRRKLADHEMYVARFYFKRAHFAGAEKRAQIILSHYKNLGLDAEALWICIRARYEAQDLPQAQKYIEQLQNAFPKSDYALKAAHLRQSLQSPAKS